MENGDKYIDIQLIDKSIRGDVELTEHECRILEEWLDSSEAHRIYYDKSYDSYKKGGNTRLSDRKLKKQYRRLMTLLETPETADSATGVPGGRRDRIGKKMIWGIATVSIAASITLIWYVLPFQRITVEYFPAEPTERNDNVASIMIEGHNPVSSENLSAIGLAKSGKIVRSGDNTIDYTGVDKSSTILNTVSVPHGTVYNLVLSDGTRVTLNSESSITFPVSFTGSMREVSLTGEACIEAAHDAGRPFVVHAAHTNVVVLGTKFIVSAYNDGVVETSLLSGRVSVLNTVNGEEATICAGQSVMSYRDGNLRVADNVDPDKISWLKGEFDFENKRIEEIITRLSKWYGIGNVTYDGGEVKEIRFTGSFGRDMELSAILDLISMVADINFKVYDDGIEVKKDS